MNGLRKQFFRELKELYWREERWLVILPEVARNMPQEAVGHAVESHLEKSAAHVNRLNDLLSLMETIGCEEAAQLRRLAREADEVLVAVARSCFEEGNVPLIRVKGERRRKRPSANGVLPAFSQN